MIFFELLITFAFTSKTNTFLYREDWEDSEHYLFTQKQGKNARNQKKTTILRVKDLKQYIEKVANSKENNLKHLKSGDNLEVCLDLDAGGGRVVAEFGIVNEKSVTQKIHPILIFKGSDIRYSSGKLQTDFKKEN